MNIKFNSELFSIFSPDFHLCSSSGKCCFFNFLDFYYLFISKTLTLVFDSEVILICSFVLLLPHYGNSAPMECQQISIYQLHLLQHTIAGFLNSNNKKITFHYILSDIHWFPDCNKNCFCGTICGFLFSHFYYHMFFPSLLINLSTF